MATSGLRIFVLSWAILFAALDHCVAGGFLRHESLPDGQYPSWSSLMTAHGATVLADIATTQRALESGASERNPLFGWAGDDHALELRAGAGMALSLSLHRLHQTHPRVARRMAWAAICLNLAVAAHNFQESR